MTLIRSVWAGLLAVIGGLVTGPALCLGAGAAERPQEKLYSRETLSKEIEKRRITFFCIFSKLTPSINA
jgi:hypothetical protein